IEVGLVVEDGGRRHPLLPEPAPYIGGARPLVRVAVIADTVRRLPVPVVQAKSLDARQYLADPVRLPPVVDLAFPRAIPDESLAVVELGSGARDEHVGDGHTEVVDHLQRPVQGAAGRDPEPDVPAG